MFRKFINYFTKAELVLWVSSVAFVLISFLIFRGSDVFSVIASLIGITALIFCAKGNPVGQALIIVFSVMYGIISFSFAYYGEMITYLCMSMPMAIIALATWLKNPYKGNKSQVKINKLSGKEIAFMLILATVVTVAFYFILGSLNTSNLITSTLSVTTSFIAAYLTFRRSPFYAIAYALNDIVLIVLWILASVENISYVSVTVCFIVFLVNDLYGFFSWTKMQKAQKEL